MRVRLTGECWEFMRIAFKVKEGAERAYEGTRTSQRCVQLLHRQRG